jgi:hypothetical protein
MPTEETFTNWDAQLAAAFQAAPLPTTPTDLPARVRRRLRRHRLARFASTGLVAVALVAGALTWRFWPERAPASGPVFVASELPDPVYLRSALPVDPLDLLARQQAAYRAVLDEMEKEF